MKTAPRPHLTAGATLRRRTPEELQDGIDFIPQTPRGTREGRLHNLCAIPVFAGIPAAVLACAGSAARGREYGWAAYCAGSAMGMTGAFALFGAAFGGRPGLAGRGGVFQRISIATGFGWMSALSFRALRQARHGRVLSSTSTLGMA
jgi:Protein of unknown function (DUF998)